MHLKLPLLVGASLVITIVIAGLALGIGRGSQAQVVQDELVEEPLDPWEVRLPNGDIVRRTPSSIVFPIDIHYNPDDFFRNHGQAGNWELAIDKGSQKTVTVEVSGPRLKQPATLSVDLQRSPSGEPTSDMRGVEVSFDPPEFALNPGETISFKIHISVSPDAPDIAHMFYYQISSDDYEGIRASHFEIRVGDADPYPRFNPLLEEIETIRIDQLDEYLNNGWELVKELENGDMLVERLVPANP